MIDTGWARETCSVDLKYGRVERLKSASESKLRRGELTKTSLQIKSQEKNKKICSGQGGVEMSTTKRPPQSAGLESR